MCYCIMYFSFISPSGVEVDSCLCFPASLHLPCYRLHQNTMIIELELANWHNTRSCVLGIRRNAISCTFEFHSPGGRREMHPERIGIDRIDTTQKAMFLVTKKIRKSIRYHPRNEEEATGTEGNPPKTNWTWPNWHNTKGYVLGFRRNATSCT